jgi:hypothetical protein
MALGEFTKQIAQQALLSATAPKETPAAPAPPGPDNAGAVFLGQIHAMQRALKEDEELVLHFHAGNERIRVMEIFLPSPRVAVLSGFDAERGHARAIASVDSLQLVARVAKVAAGAKPSRIGLITPKPRDPNAK